MNYMSCSLTKNWRKAEIRFDSYVSYSSIVFLAYKFNREEVQIVLSHSKHSVVSSTVIRNLKMVP